MKADQYPEVLAYVAELISECLTTNGLEVKLAEQRGIESAERFRREWGGDFIYIPKGIQTRNCRRNADIVAAFESGESAHSLQKRFGVNLRRIYQIILESKAPPGDRPVQEALFKDWEEPA